MHFSGTLKLSITALLLSFVGYYAITLLNASGVPAASLFATGLLIGCIVGGLLMSLKPSRKRNNPNVLYVGNIPFNAREDEVQRLFETYGKVKSVRFASRGPNKRHKGYGFVEMDREGAKEALVLSGTEFGGRKLHVNAARGSRK